MFLPPHVDLTTDPFCPKSGDDKHTVEHWFTICLASSSSRLELFRPVDVSVNLLSLQVYKSIMLAQKSLYGTSFMCVCVPATV